MTVGITTSWMNVLIMNIKAETEVILRQCRSATCTLTMASQKPELCGYREKNGSGRTCYKVRRRSTGFREFLM